MITAVAVCPHPPLLLPEIAAGAAPELDVLRAACDDAIARLLATALEQVVVVGTDDGPVPGGLRGFAPGLAFVADPPPVDPPAVESPAVDPPAVESPAAEPALALPLSLLIGSWLLDRAGDGRPRVLFGVRPDGHPATAWPELAVPTGLLVMADGSARRSLKGAGYLDDRAAPFDAAIVKALTDADAETLVALDVALAAELLVGGVGAFKALGALAAGEAKWTAQLHYDDDPYGVQYTVASWVAASREPAAEVPGAAPR